MKDNTLKTDLKTDLAQALEEKGRKVWIDTRNIRNIPYFAPLHKSSISRWLRKIRDYKKGSEIIDIVDVCEFMDYPLSRILVFFEGCY